MKRTKNFQRNENATQYLTNEQLKKTWEESMKTARICESLCNNLNEMVERMLTSRKFSGDYWLHDDMRSTAWYKLVKYWDRYDPVKWPDSCFSYFTRIIYTAFLTAIKSENRHIEGKKKYVEDMLNGLDLEIQT